MQVFRVAQGEAPSERWLQAFPDAVIERPPFAPESGAQPADICWISTGIDGWRGQVRRQAAHGRVVVHSRRPTDDEAIEALDAGAHGYCHSLSNVSILRAVVSTVSSGSLWVGPGVITRMIRTLRHSINEPPGQPPPAFATLTSREREVALAVTTGATNKEIGQQLGMTERTVKMHMGSIFQKLGVRDRVHLVLHLAKPAFEPETRH